MRRNAELENLHPSMREKVITLTKRLKDEQNPLKLFEGYRTPERQHYLYTQGRTRSGPRVTNANAWESYHQYGVACDFVLYVDGKWSWQTSGKYKKYWDQLHKLGADVGLQPLSWEKPHLQIHNLTLGQLQSGHYPEGGDESWAENLSEAILRWSKSPTPPLPNWDSGRPPIEPEADTTNTEVASQFKRYRVTARSGLRMRSGPGTNFEIVSVLSPNQIIFAPSATGEWVQVDLQGDGMADGFCHRGFLAALT